VGETNNITLGETDNITLGETDSITLGEFDSLTSAEDHGGETDNVTSGVSDIITSGETDNITSGEMRLVPFVVTHYDKPPPTFLGLPPLGLPRPPLVERRLRGLSRLGGRVFSSAPGGW